MGLVNFQAGSHPVIIGCRPYSKNPIPMKADGVDRQQLQSTQGLQEEESFPVAVSRSEERCRHQCYRQARQI